MKKEILLRLIRAFKQASALAPDARWEIFPRHSRVEIQVDDGAWVFEALAGRNAASYLRLAGNNAHRHPKSHAHWLSFSDLETMAHLAAVVALAENAAAGSPQLRLATTALHTHLEGTPVDDVVR